MSTIGHRRDQETPKPRSRREYLEDDLHSARAHGEAEPDSAHPDEGLGTMSTHGERRDDRAEEPFGEISPSADAEGD